MSEYKVLSVGMLLYAGMSNKHFASEMLVGPASLPHPPAQRYAPSVCVAKWTISSTGHHVRILRTYFSVLRSDTCTSSGRRCERVDDGDEMLSTASRYRGTSRYPITQGAHVPKHSTVYSNACSIMRYAHKQEQRSGGDRRLPNPSQR
jgi:hypothetical protein